MVVRLPCAVGPSPYLDAIIDTVKVNSITNNITKKFLAGSDKASEFYGCNTDALAEAWCKKFYIQTQGAKGTMDFAVINQGSSDESILSRLRKTVTWINYDISIGADTVSVISR